MKKKKSDVYMEVFCPVAKKPYELVEGKPICPACGEQIDTSGHSVCEYSESLIVRRLFE